MSFSLLVRLDKELDLCGAISYKKSVLADMYVHQKCPKSETSSTHKKKFEYTCISCFFSLFFYVVPVAKRKFLMDVHVCYY